MELPSKITKTESFKYKSAELHLGKVATSEYGVYEASFSGAIDEKSFLYLRAILEAKTHDAPGGVMRMDRALLMFCGPIPVHVAPINLARIGLVARMAERDLWLDYSERLMESGGTHQIVFRDQNIRRAYKLADTFAKYHLFDNEEAAASAAVVTRRERVELASSTRRSKAATVALMKRMGAI